MHARGANVYLVGFMGSGKSTTGRRLARRAGWGFADLDREVEEREGRPVAVIFRDSGEDHFRRLEGDALRRTARRRRMVVAAGGGVYLSRWARTLMRASGVTVWLDAPLSVLRSRVGDGGTRPLWRREDPTGLAALFEGRRAAYALADLRVDVAEASAAEVADEVHRCLERVFR